MSIATIKVNKLSVTFPVSRLNRASREEMADRVLRGKTPKIVKIAENHYRNNVAQVHSVLSGNGPKGVGSTGRKTVSFLHADGSSGRIITDTEWSALRPKYAKRWPRSSRFWSKRKAYDGNKMANQFESAISMTKPVIFKQNKGVAKRRGPRGIAGPTVTIEFKTLPEPLNQLITRSFAQGKTFMNVRSVEFVRGSLTVLAIVERSRPFISKMSALLGRRFILALKKVK